MVMPTYGRLMKHNYSQPFSQPEIYNEIKASLEYLENNFSQENK